MKEKTNHDAISAISNALNTYLPKEINLSRVELRILSKEIWESLGMGRMRHKEAAEFLGINERTLTRWREKGKITGHQKGKKHLWSYSIQELTGLKYKRQPSQSRPRRGEVGCHLENT